MIPALVLRQPEIHGAAEAGPRSLVPQRAGRLLRPGAADPPVRPGHRPRYLIGGPTFLIDACTGSEVARIQQELGIVPDGKVRRTGILPLVGKNGSDEHYYTMVLSR
jgi:hypothetical protein